MEVNQARRLTPKSGSKNIPGTDLLHLFKLLSCLFYYCGGSNIYYFIYCFLATYVKVYVLENGVCLAKKKTKVVKKSLDPTYQQALLFDESPQGKVLQVSDVLFPYFFF